MTDNENQINKQQDGQEQQPFDIIGLCLEFLANWKWFVLSVIVCLCVAWYHLAGVTPIYSVQASIYLKNEDNTNSSNVFAGRSQLLNIKDYIDQAELLILKSRNNLVKVVESLDLSYSYYYVGRFRDHTEYGSNPVIAQLDSVSLYNLTSPINIKYTFDDGKYHFQLQSNLGKVVEKKVFETSKLPVKIELSQGTLILKASPSVSKINGEHKIIIETPYSAAARLSGSLNLGFAKSTGAVVNIYCNTSSPTQGIDVINALIKIYNQDIWNEKNRSAMQTEQFIVERLALVESELNDAERDVEEYRRSTGIIDISSETSTALGRSREADQRLAEIDLRQRIISDVEKVVASQDDYSSLPLVIDDATVNSYISAYNKKVAQRAALLDGGTENNPIIKNLQEDIARTKNEIYRSILNLRGSIQTERNSIARQESEANSRLSSIPVNERELFGRIRKQNVKENLYNFLLEKREDISIQKTLATPQARLIDNPASGGIVSPQPQSTYTIALIIGLLIPGLIVFCRFMFFPIFKDKDDLARATKVPIIGEIPLSDGTKEFVVSKSESTAIAELFRLLRNNLQFMMSNDRKIILVTSTIAGEGKTYISSNIALTFALAGKKTIVVGLDIRRPMLAHRFNRTNDVGVTSYLSGNNMNLDSMISQSDQHENLYILPGGPVPPNPNELLMSENMEKLLDDLRQRFDYVILDSAPIGVVSDTLLIAPLTDLQLYVTRANYLSKKGLDVLHTAVGNGRLSKCYIVMNGVNVKTRAYSYRRYGYYSKHNYGYGYGYSYSNDTPRRGFIARLKKRFRK
ncbi:MAG: polysaccharide biosynthesis tyrosine autokinase [Muribaculaceae bacterium]|nr:polysaccharide biosynthesis tyrosine autokinase [Muribaculaceae bacterium]